MGKSAIQSWVSNLSVMQQSVLLSGIRGCDGIAKRHPCKDIIRFYRRCVLISAFDGATIDSPFQPGGGSFMGPIKLLDSCDIPRGANRGWISLRNAETSFVDSRDELPAHYLLHMIHAFEVLGYKHPNDDTRVFWLGLYRRLVHAFHMQPESEDELDKRLGDSFEQWAERSDESTTCSD